MIAHARAELLKQRSTSTTLGLVLGMLGLVLLAVLLHGLERPVDELQTAAGQVKVFTWGAFGALFAGLAGALSITSEIRHGTIRPTFLVTPRRGPVLAGKIAASALLGIGFGLLGETVALAVGSAALHARGIAVQLDDGDVALLLGGGAGAGALWGAIGVGVGAAVRNQVATLVGMVVWLLFVDNILFEFVPGVGRFAPGAAVAAMTGEKQAELLAPALGALVLALYAAALAAAGWVATIRRDVA